MQEVEIKLGFDPYNLDLAQNALCLLFGRTSQVKHLKNTYFDTRSGDLRLLGWSLRIRDEGGSFEQTVKGKGDVLAGLHQRFEFNQAIDQYALDVERLYQVNEIRPFLDQLQSVFLTDFQRSVWNVKIDGSLAEIALDYGEISAQSAARTISEIEVELKAGNTADLFELAAKIACNVPCWLLSDSKAKRGHELVNGSLSQRVKPANFVKLEEWVSYAGGFSQQLTMGLTEEVTLNQLLWLVSQLEKLIAPDLSVGKGIRCTAEQLLSLYKCCLDSKNANSIVDLRQVINNTTLLGELGIQIVREGYKEPG
jgi:triphosphatase